MCLYSLRFKDYRGGLSLSPSDSQRTLDPQPANGSLNILTNDNNNKTDHSRFHHQTRNDMLSQKSATDHS
eukprot:5078674-Heterocapsa_arctica.AAC.1